MPTGKGWKPAKRALLGRGPIVSLVAAALLLLSSPLHAAPHRPPPAVIVAPVTVQDLAPASSFIGRVVAIQSVQVVPRVTAFIEGVPVQQGSDVKRGQVLFKLQKAQYAASLQGAEAQLAAARAAAEQAELAYQRASRLNRTGFEAQASLDQATAKRDQDKANVLAAEANVSQAALDLSYCTITAPISGRIGAVTLTKGNLVTPGSKPLATINQLNPIRVVFSVSERTVLSEQQKTGKSAGQIAAGLLVGLSLPDGAKYPETGRIAFLDNAVDPSTGTVSVYTDFPNPQELLLPGAYVTVQVRSATPEPRLLVPVEAVQTDATGNYVVVVGARNVVKQQPVTLGAQIGQKYIVEKGLTGGERVIIAGLQKVRPGEGVNAMPAQASQPGLPAAAIDPGTAHQGG
ncbi:MAG: efflux RND transporter periplasmic adaptor subunit [Acetobacteraceae bacterium]